MLHELPYGGGRVRLEIGKSFAEKGIAMAAGREVGLLSLKSGEIEEDEEGKKSRGREEEKLF